MRRCIAIVALVGAVAGGGVASAKVLALTASPNPAVVGDRVRHDLSVEAYARLDVWVSAAGFRQPGAGTLPAGTWAYECCPAQTAGAPAWHYRSASSIPPGAYRFGAVARAPGSFLSSASSAGTTASIWIRVR